MQRWEYHAEVITHGLMGRHRDEIDLDELMATMNRLGDDGWELVRLLPDQHFHGEKDGHLMVFKRPAPG
jgi:Domain of unknown function (DUF4177)